jgi:hypothetical protein
MPSNITCVTPTTSAAAPPSVLMHASMSEAVGQKKRSRLHHIAIVFVPTHDKIFGKRGPRVTRRSLHIYIYIYIYIYTFESMLQSNWIALLLDFKK